MKLYRLSIFLSAEGWRKVIHEIEARETAVNFIFQNESGYRRLLKKNQLMNIETLTRHSHRMISQYIYARADQVDEAARMLSKYITEQINLIRAEYTAMMDQVPYQPAEWTRTQAMPMPEPGSLKL